MLRKCGRGAGTKLGSWTGGTATTESPSKWSPENVRDVQPRGEETRRMGTRGPLRGRSTSLSQVAAVNAALLHAALLRLTYTLTREQLEGQGRDPPPRSGKSGCNL